MVWWNILLPCEVNNLLILGRVIVMRICSEWKLKAAFYAEAADVCRRLREVQMEAEVVAIAVKNACFCSGVLC